MPCTSSDHILKLKDSIKQLETQIANLAKSSPSSTGHVQQEGAITHPLLNLQIRTRPQLQENASEQNTFLTLASTVLPHESISCVQPATLDHQRTVDRVTLKLLRACEGPQVKANSSLSTSKERKSLEATKPSQGECVLSDDSMEQVSVLTKQYLQRYNLI